MKTLCLLESISRADGGIFEAEIALQRELNLGQEIRVNVVGLEDQYSADDIARWYPLHTVTTKVKGPKAFGYSPDLLRSLDPDADLLYAATLWKYPSWAALQWADRTGKPMMVAPHGSLDSWALGNAAWKKRIAGILYKNRQLKKATCLRALSSAEADSFRAYGLTNPIAIVPNGVDLPELDPPKRCDRGNCLPKKLLFLGRIHPKKGLPNALRAFKKTLDFHPSTSNAHWQFIIAGWDQGGHEAELMRLCRELDLRFERQSPGEQEYSENAPVVFVGPAFGRKKKELLVSASAFILPSISEGLPMSVLEAWS